MKLNRPFNTLTLAQYRQIIPQHARYTDFNPLALYRSILENNKLSAADQQAVLALAKQYFPKFYDFLVVKDFNTYVALSRLGLPPLSPAQQWDYNAQLRIQARKILARKRIRNWRVGTQSKSPRLTISRKHPEQGLQLVQIMNRATSNKNIWRSKQIAYRQHRKHQEAELREIWQEYE